MSRNQREADSLWRKIQELEKMPVKSQADFDFKKREGAKLRAAYEKVTGLPCGGQHTKANALRSFAASVRDLKISSRPEHETKDSVEDIIKMRRPR